MIGMYERLYLSHRVCIACKIYMTFETLCKALVWISTRIYVYNRPVRFDHRTQIRTGWVIVQPAVFIHQVFSEWLKGHEWATKLQFRRRTSPKFSYLISVDWKLNMVENHRWNPSHIKTTSVFIVDASNDKWYIIYIT